MHVLINKLFYHIIKTLKNDQAYLLAIIFLENKQKRVQTKPRKINKINAFYSQY